MKNIGRIGFCCKWIDPEETLDRKSREQSHASMNQRDTTLTYLRRLPQEAGVMMVKNIVHHNCATLWKQLHWLAQQPLEMRLFRITSTFVPAHDVNDLKPLLHEANIETILEQELHAVRDYADLHGIRLCFHPGQFSNISSPQEKVVQQAIIDIEGHCKLAEKMGYGTGWHPSGFAVNIHANVRQDPDLVRTKNVIKNMSTLAQNLLTIENDEFGCGLDALIQADIGNIVPIVLDFHHHWIQSEGEYIPADDRRIQYIQDSWRGVRPLSHASTSTEEILPQHPSDIMPDFQSLKQQGLKPAKLRAHSFLMWNNALNQWLRQHLEWSDIEIEAKGKNIASRGLIESWLKK